MENVYLISGILLLLVGSYDFFFTTLSGSGAGFITNTVSLFTYKLVHFVAGLSGRNVFKYSGLLVNLMVLLVWILLIWVGLFLVFSSNAENIINNSGRAANAWERLYFTGYILSTLGLGNFRPTTSIFEILSSCFSFFGFIFFTSSITYFISVSSAIINMRTLARSINNLGKDPVIIYHQFLVLDTSYILQIFQQMQTLVDKHSVNHEAYPVIHYYSHPHPDVCLSLNLVRLDEALSLLAKSGNAGDLQNEMQPLRGALTNYLTYINNNFSQSMFSIEDIHPKSALPYEVQGMDPEALQERRKILEGLLGSERFSWKDVVPQK